MSKKLLLSSAVCWFGCFLWFISARRGSLGLDSRRLRVLAVKPVLFQAENVTQPVPPSVPCTHYYVQRRCAGLGRPLVLESIFETVSFIFRLTCFMSFKLHIFTKVWRWQWKLWSTGHRKKEIRKKLFYFESCRRICRHLGQLFSSIGWLLLLVTHTCILLELALKKTPFGRKKC